MKYLIYIMISFNFIFSQKILIPMDENQNDHLKAYGLIYWTLKKDIQVDW